MSLQQMLQQFGGGGGAPGGGADQHGSQRHDMRRHGGTARRGTAGICGQKTCSRRRGLQRVRGEPGSLPPDGDGRPLSAWPAAVADRQKGPRASDYLRAAPRPQLCRLELARRGATGRPDARGTWPRGGVLANAGSASAGLREHLGRVVLVLAAGQRHQLRPRPSAFAHRIQHVRSVRVNVL